MDALASSPDYSKFNFILVGIERDRETATDFTSRNQLNHTAHVLVEGSVPESIGLRYIPHNTLLAPDLTVIKNFDDFQWEADLDSMLRR